MGQTSVCGGWVDVCIIERVFWIVCVFGLFLFDGCRGFVWAAIDISLSLHCGRGVFCACNVF